MLDIPPEDGYWWSSGYSDSYLITVPWTHGDMAGGRRIFLALSTSMLKRISNGVSQSSLSEPKHKELGIQFFETYRACVLTLQNALEWLFLRIRSDLSLKG